VADDVLALDSDQGQYRLTGGSQRIDEIRF
jgi:hypothetical protein